MHGINVMGFIPDLHSLLLFASVFDVFLSHMIPSVLVDPCLCSVF